MSSDSEIVEILSKDRLYGFSVKNGPNGVHDLLGRYLYSMAVSHALYPYFHTLEVVLRNRINTAVTADHPIDPDRPDLYDKFPCWLDARDSLLIPDHRQEVDSAKHAVKNDLRKRYGDTAAQALRFRTPGRLVAKLPFSFWVYLFDQEYAGSGRGDSGVLWPRYFQQVFPHRAAANSGLHVVRQRLRRLHVVRNRIMHHERIAPWEDRDRALEPRRVRDDIEELVGWMSPSAKHALVDHGPLDEVFSKEYERYMQWVARRV